MIERRHRAGFEMEAAQQVRVFLVLRRQDLDRAAAAHHDVFGQVDLAHPSFAQGHKDAMGAEAEAAMLALQEIVRLPLGQHAAFDQFGCDRAAVFPSAAVTAELRRQRKHLVLHHQTTLPEEVQERIDGHVGCHEKSDSERRSNKQYLIMPYKSPPHKIAKRRRGGRHGPKNPRFHALPGNIRLGSVSKVCVPTQSVGTRSPEKKGMATFDMAMPDDRPPQGASVARHVPYFCSSVSRALASSR